MRKKLPGPPGGQLRSEVREPVSPFQQGRGGSYTVLISVIASEPPQPLTGPCFDRAPPRCAAQTLLFATNRTEKKREDAVYKERGTEGEEGLFFAITEVGPVLADVR